MAKKSTRRPTPTRPRAARKTSRKTASATRRTMAGGGDVIQLKKLRQDLDRAIAVLNRRVERLGEPSAKISEAQTLLSRWASDIDDMCDPDEQELCGPTMDLPLN